MFSFYVPVRNIGLIHILELREGTNSGNPLENIWWQQYNTVSTKPCTKANGGMRMYKSRQNLGKKM